MDKKTLLSFVIPCYRSEKTIKKVTDEIIETVSQRSEYDYEIICVNDVSPDNVYEVLLDLAKTNEKIKVVNLVKNSGKHSALLAGYSYVKGEYVISLDDDFQCPTYELWKLIEPLEKDECDLSVAKYKEKRESFIKRKGSDFNMWLSSIMIDKPKGFRFENFKAMKYFVVKELTNYKHPYPYIEGLVFRVTKRVKSIEMEERNRADDNTSGFTFIKSLSLAVNGLTAFSVIPLRIASATGVLFAASGFLFGIYIIIRKLVVPTVEMGYSSIMALLLFSFGLIMLMLGLIGEYIGRIYICINNSPQYVVRNTVNIGE